MRVVWVALFGVACACGGGPTKIAAPPLAKESPPPAVKLHAPRFKPRTAPNLIPRALLFSDAERSFPRISPDGTRICFGETKDGESKLLIGPVDDITKAKPVKLKTAGRIRTWFFAYEPNYFLYSIDKHGKENYRAYAIALDTEETVDLMPPDRATATIEGVSASRPFEVAISARAKDAETADLFVVDMRTGKSTLIFENKERFIDFELDGNFVPRIGTKITETGEKELRRILPNGSSELFVRLAVEDQLTTHAIALTDSGKTLYLRDSRNRDTTAIVAFDLATGSSNVVASDPNVDIHSLLRDPKTGKPQAYSIDPGKPEWHLLDETVAPDFAKLVDEHHTIDIPSRSKDGTKWLVHRRAPNEPAEWLLYDRVKKEKKLLFLERPDLAKYPLASMDVVHVKARDGLDLVGYLTMPQKSDGPAPLVLWVHGGPWDRDRWELNPYHQLLSSRGYAVLSVNYRGSTGFGKKLLNAGSREWGGKMQDDLIDAVAWAVEKKIADPTRVALFGGSYGGYATLVGLSRDPDRFACGIDLVGPSNLITFVESIPPSWRPLLGQFRARVGDPTTQAGKIDLIARSPLARVSAIDKPVLIAQGKNDPRVHERESSQMAEALAARHIPVTYLLYDDEGHGFSRDENVRSFTAVAEVFLSQCLGGVHEPIGDSLSGSSMRAVFGGEHIAGLAAAALSGK